MTHEDLDILFAGEGTPHRVRTSSFIIFILYSLKIVFMPVTLRVIIIHADRRAQHFLTAHIWRAPARGSSREFLGGSGGVLSYLKKT